MRAEVASEDRYVRRWRPTFGYAVSLALLIQAVGIVATCLYAAMASPASAGPVINALGSMVSALGAQWTVSLAVLGVNVAKRSQDKQVTAGQQPGTGLLGALASRLGK